MANEPADGPGRETRLNDVLAAYPEAERLGRPPDRDALLTQHPDLAEDLRSFFRDKDGFARMAEPLHPAVRYFNRITRPKGTSIREPPVTTQTTG